MQERRPSDMCRASSTQANISYYFHVNPALDVYAYKYNINRYMIALIFCIHHLHEERINPTVRLMKLNLKQCKFN